MEGKRKRKNYFSNQKNDQKKRKYLTLECGMKGFLCTCNYREKDCVREAYNILNEYAEKIYGIEEKQLPTTDKTQSNNQEKIVLEAEKEDKEEIKLDEKSEDNKVQEEKNNEKVDKEEDISNELNEELDRLKADTTKPLTQKRFQVVDTGVSNVIFIKSIIPNTLDLSTVIVEDLYKTKKQKTRYLLRMLPIQIVCKTYMEDIKPKASILFEQYFAQEPKTFCIIFNRHSNNNLHRSEVIESLAQLILEKNPGNKANLKSPEIAVIVEVVRAVCLISIAPHYFKYKKYNLLEICNEK